MSYFERDFVRHEAYIIEENNNNIMANMTMESVAKEIQEIRRKLELSLERVTLIESFIGIGKSIDKSKLKKASKFMGLSKDIINIILVEPDDDVPVNHESILVVIEPTYGELLYIHVDLLEAFCRDILMSPEGNRLPFPDLIISNKYATLNGSGEWEIHERERDVSVDEE